MYEPGEVFYVAGAILTRNGEIFKLRTFNNNTGTIQTRLAEEFDILSILVRKVNFKSIK